MYKTWVVVADSSRARIFETDSPTSPLTEVATLVHTESRVHEQALTSDLPGSQGGFDGRHHDVSDKTPPKKHEAMEFAKTLSEHLEKSRINHIYSQLILIAAPAFLGFLRENITPDTATTVILEIDKNLTQQSVDDIRQHLPARFTSAKLE